MYLLDKVNNREKIQYKNNIDLIIVFAIFMCLHMFMRFISWDDPYFVSELKKWNYNIIELMQDRYLNWTARNIIESVVFFVGELPKIIWRVLDSFFVASFYYLIKNILEEFTDIQYREKKEKYILMLIFLCWPFSTMGTTGWLSSTMITLWIAVGMLYAIMFLHKIVWGRKVLFYQHVMFWIAFIYSVNHETTFPIYFVFFIVMLVLSIKNRKGIVYLGISVVWFVVNVVYAMTAPGNMKRLSGAENKTGYLTVSLFGKIRMGINNTFYHYISVPNAVLFILCLLLCFLIFKQSKDIKKRIVGILPLSIDVIWTAYVFVSYTLKRGYLTYIYPDESFETVGLLEQYLAMIFALLLVGLIICCICIIWEDMQKKVFFSFALLLGVLPEIELGFTPAISASIMRVVIYLYTAFLLIIFGMLEKKDCLQKWQRSVLTFCALAGTAINILQVIRHMIIYG